MAGSKTTYVIAAAIFAGLSLVALTNIFSDEIETELTNESEAYAQYSSLVGIRQNIITVSGSASTGVDPNRVVISFGLETQGTTASQATEDNAQKMDAVVNAVKELGIDDEEISTSMFSVSPVYDRDRRFITGYRTSNILTVNTDQLDKASQIIDTAVAAGANRVNNVFFTLSDDLRKRVSDQLIGEAVNDAKMKAELALQPLGKEILGVKSVSLEHFGIPQPVSFERISMAPSAEPAPTPIFESEQRVTMSVSVIFLI